MNITTLIIILSILFIITMIITLYAFLHEEKKLKKYEAEGDSFANEMKRSYEYEQTSVKKYIPIQIWIYSVSIVLAIIMFVIYLYLNT